MAHVNARDQELRVQTLQKLSIHWQNDCTLEDFVALQISPSNWSLEARESRLDPFFMAANMVRICGLKLKWTESVEDHLRLDRRAEVPWVYLYKNCFVGHLGSLDSPYGDRKR